MSKRAGLPGARRPRIDDGLKREDITEERIAQIAREAEAIGDFRILSEDEREVSRRQLLAELAPGEAVWVFAYGSLMWNPAIHVAERRSALLTGYHRQFCLWMPLGRGTPEQPGLMLALERGGRCRGVALRIDPELVEPETRIVWRREMISGAYRPRWVKVATGQGPVRAVAFVVNRAHGRYAGRLPLEIQVDSIACAAGRIGRCRDYLRNLVDHLDELGVPDGPMHRLLAAVEARQRVHGGG